MDAVFEFVGGVGLLFGQNSDEFCLRAEPHYLRPAKQSLANSDIVAAFKPECKQRKLLAHRHNSLFTLFVVGGVGLEPTTFSV